MDEKEEKEASYLLKLCRWHEANLAFKKLILKRYETVQFFHSCKATVQSNCACWLCEICTIWRSKPAALLRCNGSIHKLKTKEVMARTVGRLKNNN